MAEPNTINEQDRRTAQSGESVNPPSDEPVLARLASDDSDTGLAPSRELDEETASRLANQIVEEPVVAQLVDREDPATHPAPPLSQTPGLPNLQPSNLQPVTPEAVIAVPANSELESQETEAQPIETDVGSMERSRQDDATDSPEIGDAALAVETETKPDGQVKRGFVRRFFSFIGWMIRGSFCIMSLVVLLATLTAIPIFQLIAFGYLLSVAGGLANGNRLRDSLPHLREAGQIGLAALAIIIAALPTQLLSHWESVAYLINPDSGQATAMRALAITCSAVATVYLLWAMIRGGRLKHYLWPAPKRFLREGWRWSTWSSAPDRLWDFTTSLQLPRYFWLGLRGALGTLIWLIPAMIIIAAFRNGETGLAGLVGFVAVLFLGIGMLYLPMLQAHFAAENRLSALFEVREIRRQFRRAPWAWLSAMVFALVLTPIPLYLLKIEATPREVMWLPCLVFIAFILPARIVTGLALRRARGRSEGTSRWARISRWLVRMAMPLVVGIYLLFVYVSQYTSWDGLQTWVQQHAILIPVPFLNGI